MAFLTDYKRVVGLGSAKGGTAHHWGMTISSVALLLLVPLFIFTFGRVLGQPYEVVVIYYSRPFPALVAALTLIVGWVHFKNGAQIMLEDYTRGMTLKLSLIALNLISYAAAAAGLFALGRIAL